MANPKGSLTITWLYPPSTSSTTFNLEYYLSNHITLAAKLWTPLGLTGYSVTKVNDNPDYVLKVDAYFRDAAAWDAATKSEGMQELLGDIGNFTDVGPVVVVGEVVGSG